MANFHKGQRVVDMVSGRAAKIVSVTTNPDNTPYYELDESVPTSPAYPTRWRHSREVKRDKS